MMRVLVAFAIAMLLAFMPAHAGDGIINGLINAVDTRDEKLNLDGFLYSYDDNSLVIFDENNQPIEVDDLQPGTPVTLIMAGPDSDLVMMVQVQGFAQEGEDPMDDDIGEDEE